LTGENRDVVVIGAGHAGCEAALACGRMGMRTLLLTLNLDALALMPCNPSIGGTAKGHLVREVDALGGEMGLAIDDTFLQSRMLNTGKGPAVQSLRAQADKRAYQSRMRSAIDACKNVTLRQCEADEVMTSNGRVTGVLTSTGMIIECRAVIVACGVYLNSKIIIGERAWRSGPQGLMSANKLADSLRGLGFHINRFKTGTPARLDGRTIDFSRMTPQRGDEPVTPFSFMTGRSLANRATCYLTYTTETTHDMIRANLHRSPMYSGMIKATGARYCPSIEDKIVRFSDKDRHPVFLEPEGDNSIEWYAQGLSTSMPEEVQRGMYRTVPGLENAAIMRLAYAIEYDCIDPTALDARLRARDIEGLYFAGQINGTSGYEEAAAQGIYAGINVVLYLRGEAPLTLTRSDSYIGVMADDLTVKGVDEPYRMMTSRAEYRLVLRQDNADLRLTELSHRAGLSSLERYEKMSKKRDEAQRAFSALKAGAAAGELCGLSREAVERAEIELKYEGYIARQRRQIEQFRRAENQSLPEGVDYASINSLRIEARQKRARRRPQSLGQAARIPGVTQGDVAVLSIWLEKYRREKPGAG
jgi:tRNA uridine 5-carboxymethylaminomethyl modification enzyme